MPNQTYWGQWNFSEDGPDPTTQFWLMSQEVFHDNCPWDGIWCMSVVISDGVDQFQGDERWAAEGAVARAPVGCAGGEVMENLLNRRIRVIDVQVTGDVDPDLRPASRVDYDAEVRTYTFFGIPAREVTIRSGRVVSCN
ncbi:MAG: hypothetical protein GEU73_17550 [Chloroflexi bacterium]|nr:hypothetical protein [Chloroflexota bacterium]